MESQERFQLQSKFLCLQQNYLMDSKSGLIGRLAQLRNLVSKPELNDAYVLILGYLSGKDRFSVQRLSLPNEACNVVPILVKESCLQLSSANHFSENYPFASEVRMDSFGPEGSGIFSTILKLADSWQSDPLKPVFFRKSHRITGSKVGLSDEGTPRPLTTVVDHVFVAPDDEEAIIEFEDIRFSCSSGTYVDPLFCLRGRRTTFRRCLFDNILLEVAGSDPATSELTPVCGEEFASRIGFGSPSVVFESCLFENNSCEQESAGIFATEDGAVTAINCVFRNYKVGILVGEKGLASITHCSFENCIVGVQSHEKAKEIKILNCSVTSCQKGVSFMRSGNTTIKGCHIRNCLQSGILVTGNKHTFNLKIDECRVSNCLHGLCFDRGKIEATVNSTTFTNCDSSGLLVGQSVVGNVEVNNCRFANNASCNVLNANEASCRVTVDGVVQRPERVDLGPPTLLSERRCYQQAGLCDILCGYCGKKEEQGEKFKKCGKCEDVCYCSRECQKAHWKEHKLDCKPTPAVLHEVAFASYVEDVEQLRKKRTG